MLAGGATAPDEVAMAAPYDPDVYRRFAEKCFGREHAEEMGLIP